MLIDRAPQVAPAPVHPKVRLVHMPGQAAPAAMATVDAFANLGAELLDPAVHGGRVDTDAALGHQIADISIR